MTWKISHPAASFRTFTHFAVATPKVAKVAMVSFSVLLLDQATALSHEVPRKVVASWYGEAHRGRLMANGKKFNPNRLTAASWSYALGTKVRVSSSDGSRRSVVVTITDRGPAPELVRGGRTIDLSHAAFARLGAPEKGLIGVRLQPVR